MKNIITLAALLILTTAAVVTSSAFQDSRYLVITVLGLGVVKLLLVAFQFMELHMAHLFWKAALTTLSLVFVFAMTALTI